MKNKRIQLPKEGLIAPEEVGPGEHFLDVSDDVQGHGFPLPAPPDFARTTGHGGELEPGDSEAGPTE